MRAPLTFPESTQFHAQGEAGALRDCGLSLDA
jgi:hypothetical protein